MYLIGGWLQNSALVDAELAVVSYHFPCLVEDPASYFAGDLLPFRAVVVVVVQAVVLTVHQTFQAAASFQVGLAS